MLPTFVRATPDGTGEVVISQFVGGNPGINVCAAPGREGRLPGLGPGRDKFPSASRPGSGGGAEGSEDGQSDLRHPEGNDAGARRGGATALS